MTAYAVRGLDINTSYTIYNLLNEQKKEGRSGHLRRARIWMCCMDLCDRILVLCGRQSLTECWTQRQTTKEEVGLLMTNRREGAVGNVK